MPKPARQIPAAIELFDLGRGNYSLRLLDTKYNYIGVKLAELIPDLATMQVITPTDMKIFRFDEENIRPQKTNGKLINSENLNNISEENIPDPMDEAMAMAETEEHPEPEAPAKRGPGRPRKSSVERDDKCGRCKGTGLVQVLMEGGQAGEGTCGVCHGEGKIVRFGAQR